MKNNYFSDSKRQIFLSYCLPDIILLHFSNLETVRFRRKTFPEICPTYSTLIHPVRKLDPEEDSKSENPAAQFLDFLTSTAETKQKSL